MSAREFARRGGFHETTLSKYLRVFGRSAVSTGPTSVALARVAPGTGTAAIVPAGGDGIVEIDIGRGLLVRVRRGFDEQVLAAVVRVLSERA